MFIGALDENPITNKYLIASRPYYYDYLNWCVQKQQPIPLWRNFFHICNDWTVHFWTVISAVSLDAMLYYLTQFEKIPRTWNECEFHVLGAAMGTVVAFNPQTASLRVLFIFGLFSGMLFATTLNAFIVTILTSPIVNPQITSISEIIDGEFKLVCDQYTFIRMSQQNQVISQWPTANPNS